MGAFWKPCVAVLSIGIATTSCTGSARPVARPASSTTSVSPSPLQTGPRPFSEVIAEVRSGVVRLDVLTCDGGGTGTGFLVSPTLVATVDHVVRGATVVRVTDPDTAQVQVGEVLGRDRAHDVALVRLAHPVDGHVFTLASTQPELATDMAILGFQLGGAMQSSTGAVTKQHDRRTVGGGDDVYRLSDQLLTDATQNPGNSGGPWFTRDGQVVALAESGPPYDEQSESRAQGNNGGVPSTTARQVIDAFTVADAPLPGTRCDDGSDLRGDQQQALDTVEQYFYDLSTTDFDSAFAQLDPVNHPVVQRSAFLEDVKSSQDSGPGGLQDPVEVVRATGHGLHVYVDVHFLSHQDAGKGPAGATDETCTDWTLRYDTVPVLGVRLIHRSTPTPGTPGHRACPSSS